MYGYYVLPFLFDERLAARVDLRTERGRERLAVHAVHEEEKGLGEAGLIALAAQLREMADWLGLADVHVECRRPLGVRLRALLA
ncbi:hypothetical protein D3C76_424870 [compost metagenome]